MAQEPFFLLARLCAEEDSHDMTPPPPETVTGALSRATATAFDHAADWERFGDAPPPGGGARKLALRPPWAILTNFDSPCRVMHMLLDMVMVGSHADARYEAVARFLAAFDAHQARAASEFFTSDAEVIELERDHAGRMMSAHTNARGRHSITVWLEDFIAADVQIRPTGQRWDRDALVVDATWTLTGPSGDTVTGNTQGRYVFNENLVSRLTVSTFNTA